MSYRCRYEMSRANRRTGFTLVEMLVVVSIIAILAAILVPAVYMGLSAAQDARIAMEVANLDAAMRQYKTVTHGYAYPPNFTGAAFGGTSPWATVPAAVVKHIQQKFGRLNVATATKPPDTLDPAETLVFWLQGYGQDPTNPLPVSVAPADANNVAKIRQALFDFDETRLVDNGDGDGYPVYYPRNGQSIPYVYFHHDSYAAPTSIKYGDGTNEKRVGTGVAHPYMRNASEFVNADSYQIISAGQDGDWGADNAAKQFPSGLNYDDSDHDNIANFSEGTMGDQIP